MTFFLIILVEICVPHGSSTGEDFFNVISWDGN